MIGVNDYAYASRCPGACSSQCAGASPCGGSFACCQCVSFVVQRVCRDLGVDIASWGFGDAYTWPAVAAAHNVPVNGTPAQHAVMVLPPGVSGAGSVGHVGFVLEVGPSAHAASGHVFVEDYDYDLGSGPCRYNQHALPTSGGRFIHFRDSGACSPACDSCHICVGGACQPKSCPAGTSCVNGQCLPPNPPTPPSVTESLLPLGLLAAAGAGVWWYSRSHAGAPRGFPGSVPSRATPPRGGFARSRWRGRPRERSHVSARLRRAQ